MKKVCLIVDNPLRDLEGITLIAWHLAQKKIKSYVVPMYCQAFDIIAIKPDLVVTNYLRPNNIELLKRYKKENIKICILDTEGSPGKNIQNFAKFTSQIIERNLVDLYFLWGKDQYKAFKKYKLFDDNILKITGCPRYDFCTKPYRQSLPKINHNKPFILINTTFAVGNPKFTKNSKFEAQAMINMGYSKNFAKQYAHDSLQAHKKLIKIISEVCKKLPDLNFILRPHPFESKRPYETLLRHTNFEINQTASVMEWLNACELLIHLNCQTAIEATMMGKEPISIEWINTPVLKAGGPPGNISHSPKSINELVDLIINRDKLKPTIEMKKERQKLINSRLFKNDGRSSLRASEFIYESLIKSKNNFQKLDLNQVNWRFKYKQFARELLGFDLFHKIRKFVQGEKAEFRRNEKSFHFNELCQIVQRLNNIDKTIKTIKVKRKSDKALSRNKLFSKNSFEISS